MNIIENKEYRVIRAETKPPDYLREMREFPEDNRFLCKIESLSIDQSAQIFTSLDVVEEIAKQARMAREKAFEEWSNPITKCCGVPRPRNETKQDWFMERFEVTCLPGYGCKSDEEKA